MSDKRFGKKGWTRERIGSLKGKTYVITGTTSRTGFEAARILLSKGAKSVKICTLTDKPERREHEITLDYVGFTVPNKFIVGYGIDWNERYRELPYIAYIDKS